MRGPARGFVIGELLIALLLLAVAVSSLAALMYSVSRRPSASELAECAGKGAAASARCATAQAAGGASKLLRSGCATRVGAAARNCKDTLLSSDSSDETILRARTDSASLELLARRQQERPAARPDRGFIR